MLKLLCCSTVQCLFLVAGQIFLKCAMVEIGTFSWTWKFFRVQLAASRFGIVDGCGVIHLVLHTETLRTVLSLSSDQHQLYLRHVGSHFLFSRNCPFHTVDGCFTDYGRSCAVDQIKKRRTNNRTNGILEYYHEFICTD